MPEGAASGLAGAVRDRDFDAIRRLTGLKLEDDPTVIFGGPEESRTRHRGVAVTTKERVLRLLEGLPDDCSIEDVLYHLYVIRSIDRGLSDADAGKTIPHEEVAEQLRRKWVLGAAG